MDNLSHSLTGLALGELAHRSLPAEPDPSRQRLRRRLLLVTTWAASNFPDLDLVLTPLAQRPLGYLLHHRGHTHTLLYAVPQALVLLLLTWLLWPAARALLRESRAARAGVLAMAAAGLGLHLGMDLLNVYGIHPFHPFDGRWLYGDLVFIIEPVFWLAFGAPLAVMAGRRATRRVWLAVLALVPAWFALAGYLQWGSLAVLLAIGAAAALVQRADGERGRRGLALACALAVGFVALQSLAWRQARALVAAELARKDPSARLLDLPLSAFPANPLCWSFVSVELAADGAGYRLRRGAVGVLPALNPVQSCPAAFRAGAAADGAALAWEWEHRGSVAALARLRASDCRVDAWLRFARAPALAGGVATDTRWGPPGSANFSTLALDPPTRCPDPVPGWGYPRADLLGLPTR